MIPLSFAQRRLWFLYRLDGPSSTYNIPTVLYLEGGLDVIALRLALIDVVTRHESLRTIFPDPLDDEPQQIVLEPEIATPALQLVNASDENVGELLDQAARHYFDLASEIPFRAWLFRLDEDRHVLLILVHHIATDGWSLAPLARDLSEAYSVRRQGKAPSWPSLPVQYADYTIWQRELLGEENDPRSLISQQLAFWQTRLASLPEELELPTDRPRPSVASYRGDSVDLRIDADLHEQLLVLAREQRGSLFMVLQAAISALLTKFGAGTDIPLGSPIAGRTDEALNDLVGFFVNTLVLRTDTSGNPSFRDLLARVREANSWGVFKPGPAIRTAGRGVETDPFDGASSAVSGIVGPPEQHPCQLRAIRSHGDATAERISLGQVRSIVQRLGAAYE